MQCPYCHAEDTKVIDSRLGTEGLQVRRRRECIVCAERFTTYETIELSLPRLIKKDGTYEQFDESKLKDGIMRAIEKRPINLDEVDKIIDDIKKKLSQGEREVSTSIVGNLVMQALRDIDEVAYVRFASVYRQFKEAHEFSAEVAKLKADNKYDTALHYDIHIFMCTNQKVNKKSCSLAQPEAMLQYLKQKINATQNLAALKVRVNKSGCLGRCSLGPAMVIYPQGIWYTYQDFDDLDEIIASHLGSGKIVSRLQIAE